MANLKRERNAKISPAREILKETELCQKTVSAKESMSIREDHGQVVSLKHDAWTCKTVQVIFECLLRFQVIPLNIWDGSWEKEPQVIFGRLWVFYLFDSRKLKKKNCFEKSLERWPFKDMPLPLKCIALANFNWPLHKLMQNDVRFLFSWAGSCHL